MVFLVIYFFQMLETKGCLNIDQRWQVLFKYHLKACMSTDDLIFVTSKEERNLQTFHPVVEEPEKLWNKQDVGWTPHIGWLCERNHATSWLKLMQQEQCLRGWVADQKPPIVSYKRASWGNVTLFVTSKTGGCTFLKFQVRPNLLNLLTKTTRSRSLRVESWSMTQTILFNWEDW